MRFEAGSCSQFFGSLVRALSVGVTELTLASCEYEVGLIGRETGFAIVTKQKLLDGDTIPALTGSYAVRKPPLDKKSWINDTPSFSLPAIGRVRPAGPLASSSHAHHDYHLGGGSRHHTSGSEAPRTVLVYCRRCISSRLQWTTAFFTAVPSAVLRPSVLQSSLRCRIQAVLRTAQNCSDLSAAFLQPQPEPFYSCYGYVPIVAWFVPYQMLLLL